MTPVQLDDGYRGARRHRLKRCGRITGHFCATWSAASEIPHWPRTSCKTPFAKVVARPEQAPPDEGIVPWFYRTLRNAAIDQFRRRGTAHRAYEAFARELEAHDAPSDDMQNEICACVSRLAATLKPEYAEALTAIEVGGTPVKVFAEQKGLSSNNAAVRVFRAREALKKRVTESCGTCAEHGCVNCTCRQHR